MTEKLECMLICSTVQWGNGLLISRRPSCGIQVTHQRLDDASRKNSEKVGGVAMRLIMHV
jgi:hypothetical protein